MSISKEKGGKYYKTRFTIAGVRIQRSTKCTNRAEAQEYEDRLKQQLRDELILGKKPRRTWIEAKTRWLQDMGHKRSIKDDIWHLDYLEPHLDHLYLHEITTEVVKAIADQRASEDTKIAHSIGIEQKVAIATVNRLLALIRAIFNRAKKDWGWIDSVPVIKLKKENNARVRWLTKEEAERLIAELPKHLAAMARFTLATGLRSSNVTQLKWEQIDLARRHLVIPKEVNKSKQDLGIPLNDDAILVLRHQLGKHQEYVFVYAGKPIVQPSKRAWQKALKRAGITDFRWHDLRHTWASWHVQNGTPLHVLQALGGWSSFEMVLRYAHLSSDQLKDAAQNVSKKRGLKLVQRRLALVK